MISEFGPPLCRCFGLVGKVSATVIVVAPFATVDCWMKEIQSTGALKEIRQKQRKEGGEWEGQRKELEKVIA